MSKIELVKLGLQTILDNIDTENSHASDDECDEILDLVNKVTNIKTKLSKYQACKYLRVSRATFDNWVRAGKIPEGKKEQGFTEKFWYKEDLINLKNGKNEN